MAQDNIVDSAEWLRDRAETLMSRRDPQAEVYWRRLLSDANLDEGTRHHASTQLGICLFRRAEFNEALTTFEGLPRGTDGFEAYAIGQCKLSLRKPGAALVAFLEAFVTAPDHEKTPDYLRATADALARLGLKELAHAVMLGALERDPQRPATLEALGSLYEQMELWVEAIRTKDALIDLLKSNLPVQFRDEPTLETGIIAPSKAEDDLRMINEHLRKQFALVDVDADASEADYAISLSNYPAGLHTLVSRLLARKDPERTLEVAQRLWAVARHDGLGEHLSPEVLAATVQWLAERMTWRLPTPPDDLRAAYGVEAEQIRAAARLLVSRYDAPLLPISWIAPHLTAADVGRLKSLVTAILLDVPLSEVQTRTLLF